MSDEPRDEVIPELEPRIIAGPRQVVAVSSNRLALRIGVVAPTEAEARVRFAEELQAWRDLRERFQAVEAERARASEGNTR